RRRTGYNFEVLLTRRVPFHGSRRSSQSEGDCNRLAVQPPQVLDRTLKRHTRIGTVFGVPWSAYPIITGCRGRSRGCVEVPTPGSIAFQGRPNNAGVTPWLKSPCARCSKLACISV